MEAEDRFRGIRRPLSRREFLGLGVVGGIGMACSPQAGGSPTTAPGQPAAGSPAAGSPAAGSPAAGAPAAGSPAAGQPVRGGVLRMALAQDITGFDPHHNISLSTIVASGPCYNGLVRLDPETGQRVVGDLAERWTVSPDGLAYTFTLKSGIKWHDGKPLTTDDVLFSLKKMSTPVAGKTVTMTTAFVPVSRMEAVDDRTVRLVLKEVSPDLIWELAKDQAKIEPQHVALAGTDLNKTVVGTGPFMLKSYSPGSSIELVRNPNYTVEPGRPLLDSILMTVVPDLATRIAALATGRVDTFGRAGPEWLNSTQVKDLQTQNPAIKAYPVADRISGHFMMNSKLAPFKDVRVRKAAFLAFDRQLAIQVISKGAGELPGFFPPGWGSSQQELGQFPGFRQPKDQDRAEAKQLLTAAGFPGGLDITVLTRTIASTLEIAQFAAQQLATVGIRCTLKPVEDGKFFSFPDQDVAQASVFTPSPAMPVNDFAKAIALDGRFNYTGLGGEPRNKDLWDRQSRELDENKRKALLKDIERLWYTDLFGTAPLVSSVTYYATTARVQGFVSPALTGGGMLYDRVWIKE